MRLAVSQPVNYSNLQSKKEITITFLKKIAKRASTLLPPSWIHDYKSALTLRLKKYPSKTIMSKT